jgi:hypothetical protein
MSSLCHAQYTNRVLIKWHHESHLSMRPSVQADAQLAERYYAHDKTLWGIFVHGAPAYLTNNINPSRGLSNGTPVRMDSLGFHPGNAMELQQYNQLLADIANARPGPGGSCICTDANIHQLLGE